ncbi:putative O-glycosylation ligase, exosortase A system-associated [Govanella unica]|uniref:O-glycosylation ligase, exosortase A system-associated n=1 Tax=Govanella unica TaxID=2975056 RepID=A0A9X3TXK0_9PROT|nr:putative O-glycosylation ligase, exosortase A system-associated [Govania unica]MDA5193588.1 putative O-glycosylation ligase, exosortase A system-associated [Govania unica]
MLRSLFIAISIFAALPVVLFKPHVGVLLWSWISYMNPHRLTYGFAYSFGFLNYIGGATILGFFIAREPKSFPRHPIVWLLLIYFLWTTVTAFFGLYEDPWSKWERFAKIILFTFMTMALMQSKNRLLSLVWVIALSMGFFAVKGGIFTLLSGGTARVWGPPETFFEDNNQFALAITMLLPLIRYLQLQTTNKYLRWITIGMFITGLFSIFGTQSRGALIAVVAMALYMAWKTKKLLFGITILMSVGMIGLVFMPSAWRERMSTISDYQEDASAQGRLTMWKFAIDVANDHPIMGGGFDVFYDEGLRAHYLEPGAIGRAVHSIYFEVLGEHGYVGLLLFLLLAVTTYFACNVVIERTKDYPDLKWQSDLASMLQVSMVGYAVAGAFLNLATFDLYYHVIAMAAILRVMVDRSLKEKENGVKQPFAPPNMRFHPAKSLTAAQSSHRSSSSL